MKQVDISKQNDTNELIVPSIFDDVDIKITKLIISSPELNMQQIGEKVGLSRAGLYKRISKPEYQQFMIRYSQEQRNTLEQAIQDANIEYQRAIPEAMLELRAMIKSDNEAAKFKACEFILTNKSIFDPFLKKDEKLETKEEIEAKLLHIAEMQGITIEELKETEGIL